MQTTTIVMMTLILTIVWGGFAVLLILGIVKERGRRREKASGAGADPAGAGPTAPTRDGDE